LLARIRAILRRSSIHDGERILKLSNLKLDRVTHKVTREDHLLNLTLKEFELLEYLLKHQGSIVSREMLSHDVWHETQRATPLDNVIDVHIAHLRKKIDEPFEPKLLQTVRGVGFLLGGGKP
jgi:DNA-binding response OmpR family regulator